MFSGAVPKTEVPEQSPLLNPGDSQIAPGLNTTDKDNAFFPIRFVYVGAAHGLVGEPFAGQDPHAAYAAAAAAASVGYRPPAAVDHRLKYRLIPGAGEFHPRVLHGYPVPVHTVS
jgi:hypothetical protein